MRESANVSKSVQSRARRGGEADGGGGGDGVRASGQAGEEECDGHARADTHTTDSAHDRRRPSPSLSRPHPSPSALVPFSIPASVSILAARTNADLGLELSELFLVHRVVSAVSCNGERARVEERRANE
jgi:hypothetical protein